MVPIPRVLRNLYSLHMRLENPEMASKYAIHRIENNPEFDEQTGF